MNLRHIILAAMISLLPCFVANVHACQCRERQPPCSQFREADAVFVGLVANIVPPHMSESVAEEIRYERVSFNLERAFRGVEGNRVELINWGTSCDYSFKAGNRYLVYAYRNSTTGKLSTHYCSRTAELSKAAVDLNYINKLAAAAPEKLIAGVLADGQKTLRNIRVTAQGEGKFYRSVSDRAGWFNLAVSKPGKYKVRIFLPHNVGVAGTSDLLEKISGVAKTRRHYIVEYEVDVQAGGCTFIDVPLFIFGSEANKDRARS